MKKIKFLAIVFPICLLAFSFGNKILAAGSATVSWSAPTTDQGGGALTGLAGYRVYYDTASRWASSCSLAVGSYVNVSGGSSESYFFNNSLTPGQTYYFTVVAYDDATPANVGTCASDGTDTEVSKVVTYSGDINAVPDHQVNSSDFTILADDYGESICGPSNKADINRDCHVNSSDFTILADDYGESF
jgi:hypothetical protein